MNYTLRIPLESEALEQILADLTLDVAEMFPHSLQAVKHLAEAAQEHWLRLAAKQVPPPWRAAYREAVKVEMALVFAP